MRHLNIDIETYSEADITKVGVVAQWQMQNLTSAVMMMTC